MGGGLLFFLGGWVGEFVFLLCMGAREVEENEAVRMSYCKGGLGGWVGWEGGWERTYVEQRERNLGRQQQRRPRREVCR